jgi:ABC-type oligopeptide transport system substrate-binding subunit
MKTYSIFATITIALLLTACSADEEQTTTVTPNKVQNFDSFDMTAKEGDSITTGEPTKPKGKD